MEKNPMTPSTKLRSCISNNELTIKDVFNVQNFSDVDSVKLHSQVKLPLLDSGINSKLIPELIPSYKFNFKSFSKLIYGIAKNKNTYIYGHTGTGKSSLVAQVCARLNYPMIRVNFDSEISRMDLVGRDTLVSEGGVTVSKFVEGILPQAMQQPCVLLCDEIDFVRPDVMYVFQRVLEGDGLVLTEDGGRIVMPHPDFRIVATANTCGQGDDTAMYQGARPQSMATLDRFENWIKLDYMGEDEEKAWLKDSVPNLPSEVLNTIAQYSTEHRMTFKEERIVLPLSPRTVIALAESFLWHKQIYDIDSLAVEEAFEATVLARSNRNDRIVMTGILKRLAGGSM